MSFVLFEIIVPAEKEDLQNDIQVKQKSDGSDSDKDGDTTDDDCGFSDEFEEWNTSEEESKINKPSNDTDKGCSGPETEDSKKKDISSQEGKETGTKSNSVSVSQVAQADAKKECFTVNKGDEHSHESKDVRPSGNQQPKETGLNLKNKSVSGENNPQNPLPTVPNDKNKTESEENCESGDKQTKNVENTAFASGKKQTPNQKQNEKDATNLEKAGEIKSQEKPNQNKPNQTTSDEKGAQNDKAKTNSEKLSVSGEIKTEGQPNQNKPYPEKTLGRQHAGNEQVEGIKHSQRKSNRKKKKDHVSVKTVKDKKNKIPDSGQNKNDEKNNKLKTESVQKSENEESGKTTNTDQSQGKNKLGRKVQFQSLKQKSDKKSGNNTEENFGYNSTETSGHNSIENSVDNSGCSTDRKSISSRNTPKYDYQFSMEEFIPVQISTLLESVKETICYLDIKNSVIIMTDDQLSYKVSFVEESGSRCEIILKFLKSCGVGRKNKSSISVIPVSIYYDIDTDTKKNEELKDSSSGEEIVKDDEFKKSVRARLVVDQVVQSVKTNAALTFDYLVLICLASLIAAVGLIENSSVVLVASMLISPLMGPILAIVFGSVIKNPSLWKLGLKNELIGLGVCISCGFVFGLLPAGLTMIDTKWRITDEFPTIEMSSRGTPRSLGVGMLIAIPSGAGVALSVLGGNMGSLVGVAISASLLPPAVNAGMLWAYSIMTAIVPPRTIPTESLGNLTDDLCDHFEFIDNTYQPNFFCDMWKEAAMLGLISLVLTILNIGAILLMGCLVLKVKEVVPLKEKDTFTEFFHSDIKIARKSYQTHKNYESRALFERYSRQNQQKVIKDSDNRDQNILFPNNVKLVSRKKIESIAAEEDVLAITQRLNRPFSYNYNLSEKSLKSLVPEQTSSAVKGSIKEEASTENGPGRKFEVVTYPDEISNKDKLKENEPKATDDNDPSIQRELQQLDKILQKPTSVSMEEIKMQVLNKDQSAERDDNIEVEEAVPSKSADFFVNPTDDHSQNPPTLMNSPDTVDTNKSDCDKTNNIQEAKCDTDSEGEVSQPLLNLNV